MLRRAIERADGALDRAVGGAPLLCVDSVVDRVEGGANGAASVRADRLVAHSALLALTQVLLGGCFVGHGQLSQLSCDSAYQQSPLCLAE